MSASQTSAATTTAPPLPKARDPQLRRMADAIRVLAMDAVEQANSGHPGMPMGMADVATVLWSRFLKFDPARPDWPDRDRFVLSAGHGSMLLYALLHLTGYPGMTIDELKRFRQLGSRTAGHPEYGHAPGIETTTGPLGQGLANAVGMALAERLLAARFGDGLVDHHTYVIAGDGCLMEGISQEAISLAGHLRLGKLIVLWDDNSHLDRRRAPISRPPRTSSSASPRRAGRPRASTAMIPRRSPPPSTRARRQRAAVADRLPHHHRLRRAEQGRQPPRRTARRWAPPRSPARAQRLGWSRRALRRARRMSPAGGATSASAAPTRRKPGSSGSPPRLPATRAEFERRQSGALPEAYRRGARRHQGEIRRRGAEDSRRARRRAWCSTRWRRCCRSWSAARPTSPAPTTPRPRARRVVTAADFAGNYIHYGVREHRHGGGDERPRRSMAASSPMAGRSWSSPIIAGRRSASRR